MSADVMPSPRFHDPVNPFWHHHHHHVSSQCVSPDTQELDWSFIRRCFCPRRGRSTTAASRAKACRQPAVTQELGTEASYIFRHPMERPSPHHRHIQKFNNEIINPIELSIMIPNTRKPCPVNPPIQASSIPTVHAVAYSSNAEKTREGKKPDQ
ncbi:hypothetical protein BU16DRAFT_166995 [Lophium mytilinum]|uniref:Uncharacterized protein n=1 Tax=Lophium mytilinum TaxID=390894 RepID=A0A6A6QC96_9PEZI|nr:hypothetical protein BU16DRAFT_166995 [Lophium mytilinum]